ncbi:MAG: hypothetical protein V2A78_03845 [bacterium]
MGNKKILLWGRIVVGICGGIIGGTSALLCNKYYIASFPYYSIFREPLSRQLIVDSSSTPAVIITGILTGIFFGWMASRRFSKNTIKSLRKYVSQGALYGLMAGIASGCMTGTFTFPIVGTIIGFFIGGFTGLLLGMFLAGFVYALLLKKSGQMQTSINEAIDKHSDEGVITIAGVVAGIFGGLIGGLEGIFYSKTIFPYFLDCALLNLTGDVLIGYFLFNFYSGEALKIIKGRRWPEAFLRVPLLGGLAGAMTGLLSTMFNMIISEFNFVHIFEIAKIYFSCLLGAVIGAIAGLILVLLHGRTRADMRACLHAFLTR